MPHEDKDSFVACYLTKEKCSEILCSYYGNNVRIIDSTLQKFSNPLGYLGDYSKLCITYNHENKPKEVGQITFFIKSVPEGNANQCAFVKEMGVFHKEVLVYRNLINPFLEHSSKPFAPRLVSSEVDKCMILEDMAAHGYAASNSNYLSFEQSISVMKTLARFHGASVIYEEMQTERQGRLFRIADRFHTELSEATFSYRKDHVRQKWCVNTGTCVARLLDCVTNNDSDSKTSETFLHILFTKMPDYLKPSTKFRNVCTHDDLWCNNIMFNDSLDSVLVDFQLVRYSPPSFDVLLFLFINLDALLFERSKDTLLEVYYDAFRKELQSHSISIEEILPMSEFYESLDFYILPALIEAVMYGTNVYIKGKLNEKILSDVDAFREFMYTDRSKHVLVEYKVNEMYRKRLNQVLLRLAEYLKSYSSEYEVK